MELKFIERSVIISYQENVVKRNVSIMWFANFFIASSMTMILPFISLFIETFGNFSDVYVQNWACCTFGFTFVAAFLFVYIWGRIGVIYGRQILYYFIA